MALSTEQTTATLAHLGLEAERAEAIVNAKTLGFWHGLISGDTGGGERTYVYTVKEVLIPSLRRRQAAAAVDDAAATEWLANAHYAEESLAQVEGYAAQGTVDQILKDTVVQSESDAKNAVKAAAPYVAFGGGLALVLVLGFVILLYAPHPR